ncbi:MAG: hypothetical protein JRN21_10155 [Nitrososphaerota archaeon]|nr:hypothetical protein [Nitrososphaerota archaeon]
MSLDALQSDPNNRNPFLQKIAALSLAYDKTSPKQVLESRATIGTYFGGSILAEILDREPDPRNERLPEQRLGRWGGNVEVYAMANGTRKVVITNGYSRKVKSLFREEKSFMLRRVGKIWTEWKENISR